MKKFIIALLLTTAAASLAADAIEPYLTKKTESELNRGIAVTMPEPGEIYPLFKAGMVMNTNDDPMDPRNFGRYVETYTGITYDVEGESLTDLIFIVYSNLSSISVSQGEELEPQSLIGLAGGPGTPIYPESSELYLYIYTLEMSPYLLKATGGRFIEDGDFIWWDPGFLITPKD